MALCSTQRERDTGDSTASAVLSVVHVSRLMLCFSKKCMFYFHIWAFFVTLHYIRVGVRMC